MNLGRLIRIRVAGRKNSRFACALKSVKSGNPHICIRVCTVRFGKSERHSTSSRVSRSTATPWDIIPVLFVPASMLNNFLQLIEPSIGCCEYQVDHLPREHVAVDTQPREGKDQVCRYAEGIWAKPGVWAKPGGSLRSVDNYVVLVCQSN